jgi:hypothetical protein
MGNNISEKHIASIFRIEVSQAGKGRSYITMVGNTWILEDEWPGSVIGKRWMGFRRANWDRKRATAAGHQEERV